MTEHPTAPEATDESARLYLAVIRLSRTLRRDAQDGAIGHGGLSALATLVQEGPQRAGTLAVLEGVTAPAMTRILKSLESLGYVVRTTDPSDGRAQLVTATAAGQVLVQQGRSARMRALAERYARLPAASREAITAALDGLEQLSEEN